MEIINLRNKYCSNVCQKEYEYKEYIKNWRDNKINGLKGEYQISNHIKYIPFLLGPLLNSFYSNDCTLAPVNRIILAFHLAHPSSDVKAVITALALTLLPSQQHSVINALLCSLDTIILLKQKLSLFPTWS